MIPGKNIRRIHLIGICGTGMGSLAAMLRERGFEVTGSDEAVYPPMSDLLAARGIGVLEGYDLRHLQPEPDLVVVGNALSRGNSEIEYVLNFRIPYTSLPEAIKDFFLRGRQPVVVTGTHGKTTTTAMLACVLDHAGWKPGFLMGGVAENFNSSYGLGEGSVFVVEGDEYDSAFFDKGPKFLHYLPEVAVLGNIEFDHADIYSDLAAIKLQFSRFVNLLPERGFLAVGADSPEALEVCERVFCLKETFALAEDADWGARNVAYDGERLGFDILYQKKLFRRVRLRMAGDFNVRNALAATCVLHHLGVPEDDIRDGLEGFRGVRRRLQLRAEVDGIRIYEDFAHHPTAVRLTLRALREALQPKRLWAVYEPRSATSRRNVFQREIAAALGLADLIALPALFRPEKIPAGDRLDLEGLVRDLEGQGRAVWNPGTVEGIIDVVCREAHSGDVIVILSNGSFGGICEKLPSALSTRQGGYGLTP